MAKISKVSDFFRDVRVELLQKVTWPSRKVLLEVTCVVLIFIMVETKEEIKTEKTKSSVNWYLLSVYSGYEDKVKKTLLQKVKSLGKEDKILKVEVPIDYQVRLKNGKREVVPERVYPGYVLIEMILDDDTWLLVRNTPYVVGFVGSEGKPTPLSDEEVNKMLLRVGADEAKAKLNFDINDSVKIVGGPFDGMIGVVEEIDKDTEKAKVRLMLFGRDMPVELDFVNIDKI